MSGFVKNDWNRFLNGGTSQYNFSYRSEAPPTPIEPVPVSVAPIIPIPSNSAKSVKNQNKKTNKVVIPTKKGGKRKTIRRSKQHLRR